MKWLECDEENYPDESTMDRAIVSYVLSGERHYDKFSDCPYGWNVLCKLKNSRIIILDEPENGEKRITEEN